MERLAIDPPHSYDPVEVAIHVARYSIAFSFAEGRRVLDSSCGEGYGSWLLLQHGASHVTGVDISPEAIQQAQASFNSPLLSFVECDAHHLINYFPHHSFDLIVSLETVEHIADPKSYLLALRTLAAEDAVIILSCPNDYWYYPDTAGNPYHLRKYSFSEFQQLTQSILGNAVTWHIGTALFGFGTTEIATRNDYPTSNWPTKVQTTANAYTVPSGPRHAATTSDCSYFIGIWNNNNPIRHTAAYFPVSMNHGQRIYTEPSHWSAFRHKYDDLLHELKRLRLEVAVLRSEHRLMVDQTQQTRLTSVSLTALNLRAQVRALAIRQLKRTPTLFAYLKRLRNKIPPRFRQHI